jgi:hypothetical protein
MRRGVIKTLMRRTPFKPFAICVTNGDEFEVRHPEAAYLARQFSPSFVHPSLILRKGLTWYGLTTSTLCIVSR